MKAKIICMASAKGGSGKTVLTATFGSFLTTLNKRVLLIDGDASTNGLTLMYLKEVMLQSEYAIDAARKPGGTFQLYNSAYTPEVVSLKNNVFLLPATYSFVNTENADPIKYKESIILFLKTVRENFDFIFLDAQAGSDYFAGVAMSKEVSDEVIIVSEYDPLSAAGIERLKGIFREDLTYVRTWVLLNKMLPDFVQSFSDFLEVAKYLSPIPWDADVVRAYARRKLAIDTENGNEFTLAIIRTLESLLGDAIIPDIEIWTKERANIIRQPVEDQYQDIEKQLAHLMNMRLKIEKRTLGYILKNSWSKILLSIIVCASLSLLFEIVFKAYGITINTDKLQMLFLTAIPIILSSIGIIIFIKKEQTTRGRTIFTDDSKNNLEQLRVRRQIEILEEKLHKLEVLRGADLETLIKLKKPQ
jgi:cellulose biosynthesis protein BcsQ